MYRSKRKLSCQLFFAITLLTCGCFLFYFHSKSIDYFLEFQRTLKPNGLAFEMWRKPPVREYQTYYLFNWTNPQDLHLENSKPHFVEVGPFVFRMRQEKVDVVWNKNGTVTYRLLKHWFFDEAKSVSNLSTKITTINVVPLSAAYSVRFWPYLLKKGLNFGLNMLYQELFVQKTVGEIIFDGYEDPVIDLAKNFRLNSFLPMPNADKFAWFYKRNGSNFGDIFNTKTEGDEIGLALEWNYRSELPYFRDECDKVKGSLGEYLPIPLKKDRAMFFQTEMCRSLALDYVEEVEVEGIVGYKYAAGDSIFDNGTAKPENLCYDNSLPYGMINMSSCKYGTPSFLSLPHFYKADGSFIDKVEGLRPNQSQHEMFFLLEPTTGILIRGAARYQLNVLLQPIKYISMFSDVPTLYFPVLWIDQTLEFPFIYRLALKMLLILPNIMLGAAVICTVLGIALICFGLRIIRGKRRKLLKRDIKFHDENTSAALPESNELLANVRQEPNKL